MGYKIIRKTYVAIVDATSKEDALHKAETIDGYDLVDSSEYEYSIEDC